MTVGDYAQRREPENKDRSLVGRFMEPPREAVLDDRPIRVLQEIRFWGGLGIAVLVKGPTAMHKGDWAAAWALDGALRVLLTPVLLLVTVPVVVAGYVAAARPGSRRRMIGRLPGPLKAVGAFLGHVLLAALSALVPWWLFDRYGFTVTTFLAIVLGVYGLARGIGFVLYAFPAVSRHMFRTVEVHQALPALITVVLAWEFVLQDAFFPFGDWPQDTLLLPVGGATTTTAIAAFELMRLRSRHGIRLRSLPAATVSRG
ncbi:MULTISPECIES: hypothetical protein [unclassified Streptomyces]|uniref:hypothetical protein n=1 Tax=unclassified Streptomyces TaxID=2593676 RepID=UPI002250A9CE|nr:MULTISPECIES: hypothetical protein [unclassified Streptomyces]MCX4524227.1 hypothetical protein [Streptomyces sp. NBC_01551]MCX4545253.1 hypothetical protein [Streptomyces sp. NBC_01565]